MAFIRIFVMGFIALTVIYFCVSVYSRSVRREWLEDTFDEDHPDGAEPGARDAFVEAGMVEYKNSLRPKLIGLVYVVPVIFFSIVTYVINAN